MPQLALGKREARVDHRVPLFANLTAPLPPPPANSNWYAAVGFWNMLDNDSVGDCVDAAIMHAVLQLSTYAGSPLYPSASEAIALYSATTGYIPGDPSTDQGSYVMGPGGVMEYWMRNGIICGGKLNKVSSFATISPTDHVARRQAINTFGGLLTGIQLPQSIVANPNVPFVWDDPSGPVAGGHMIWINGYETLYDGTVLYDLVSWGARYRATSRFLEKICDEMCVIYDAAELNKANVDGAGLSADALKADMRMLSA